MADGASPASVNAACLCSLWNDISGITSAAVALPPRNPYRSTSTTSAPASAAAAG